MDWNIQSRSRFCSVCQRKFVDKQTYQTALYDVAHNSKVSYQREDLCQECWKNLTQTSDERNDGKTCISQWQGVYHAPVPVVQNGAVQQNTIEILLRKIVTLKDDNYKNAAYILAVMLERKRILKIKNTINHGSKKITIYEQANNGDVFAIEDPELSIHSLETTQRQVCKLLEEGLPAEAEIALANAQTLTPENPTPLLDQTATPQ